MAASDAESLGSWMMSSSDDDPHANDPIAPEPTQYEMQSQANMFWQMENGCRLRNGSLTPMEKVQLETLPLPTDRLKQDMKRIISLYGKSSGAGAAWRRVASHLISNDPGLQVGQGIPTDSVYFPLLKHSLMAERSLFAHRQETSAVVGFSCLPETSLMPLGCSHVKLKLVETVFLPHLLCQHCSMCRRCGKFLVLDYHWNSRDEV